MLQYQVIDIEKFFEKYEFDEDMEGDIRERFDEGDKLYVRQDATMFWQEEMEEEEPELMDEEDFRAEAEEVGSVATETLSDIEDALAEAE